MGRTGVSVVQDDWVAADPNDPLGLGRLLDDLRAPEAGGLEPAQDPPSDGADDDQVDLLSVAAMARQVADARFAAEVAQFARERAARHPIATAPAIVPDTDFTDLWRTETTPDRTDTPESPRARTPGVAFPEAGPPEQGTPEPEFPDVAAPQADTAALLRELSSLGLHDPDDAADTALARTVPPARPAAGPANKAKRRGLFGH
jgi:hypothetical protein